MTFPTTHPPPAFFPAFLTKIPEFAECWIQRFRWEHFSFCAGALFRIPPSNGLPVSHGGQLRSLLWLGGDDGEVWGGGFWLEASVGSLNQMGRGPGATAAREEVLKKVNVALSCSGKCRFKKNPKKQPKENKAKLKRRVRRCVLILQDFSALTTSGAATLGQRDGRSDLFVLPTKHTAVPLQPTSGPPPSPPLYSSSPHYRSFFIAARVKQHMSGRRWCAVAEMSAARRRRVP